MNLGIFKARIKNGGGVCATILYIWFIAILWTFKKNNIKTLNEIGCVVTIKEINSVTGFTETQIYNKQKCSDTIIIDTKITIFALN